VGLGLALAAMAMRPGWLTEIDLALQKAAFIAAFFAALSTLRHAADTSPAIQRSGRFLAAQPPGRRYAALTVGGQLFGILLSYGAIALLGSLATANAKTEPDPEIQGHRRRRMLLAIQRGFVSTLPWSPLAFAVAISTALVPGASWEGAVLPCLASGALVAGIGWALDTVFKPRLGRPAPPPATPEGSWASLLPLIGLLGLIALLVILGNLTLGLSAVATVMLAVPAISALWVAVQTPAAPLAAAGTRAVDYWTKQLPEYRGELVLLMMAGFIGTLGGQLLAPVVAGWGVDLTGLPAWTVLIAIVWIVPLAGQIGANPILAVSLMAPLLPEAAALGLDPNDYILAITAGWALSGASSPYTATTLLVGAFGDVTARHVGLIWNGAYTLLTGLALSGWVVLVAAY